MLIICIFVVSSEQIQTNYFLCKNSRTFNYSQMSKINLLLMITLLAVGCNKTQQKTTANPVESKIQVPVFSSDSAYQFVRQQVNFGPRVPNSKAHQLCSEYLSATLTRFGATVTEQRATLTAFDGTKLNSVNIIGSFNVESKDRILLFSHWDSRPWSDHDPDKSKRNQPVSGANDGASGVGVLLEMARQLGIQKPNIGIDIIFFDAEDYGATENTTGNSEDSYCLGTQYWCKNPHTPNYTAHYGILLDMVGAPDAKFYKEQISMQFAAHVVNSVWSTASKLGFGQYFIDDQGGGITDDHLYVNKLANIPSIDIIQYDPASGSGFGAYWHTTNDTMENIDKNTLLAVGTTLLNVVYTEAP